MAAILGQRYQPLFENAEEIFAQYMQVIYTIMNQARENLTEAVRRHAEELADDVVVRDFRDEAMAETREAVFSEQLSRSGLALPAPRIRNTTILPQDLIETIKPPSDLLRKAVAAAIEGVYQRMRREPLRRPLPCAGH